MRVSFTVGIYQHRIGSEEQWTALTPEHYNAYITGQGEVRLRERMVERLRDALRRARPVDQELFQLPVGTELVRVPVDVKLDDGRVQGMVPLIVEPRWTDDEHQRLFCYHPTRRSLWFLAEDRADVTSLTPAWIRHAWRELDEDDRDEMMSNGKDRLTTIALSTEPLSLLDQLPSRKKDNRAGARAWRSMRRPSRGSRKQFTRP